MLGFPSDEGVRRNGGRVGAAAGPAALRRALYRLVPDAESGERFLDIVGRTLDLGDLAVTGDLEADQERLGETLAPHIADGAVAIVLGGGHETAFGHFLAYVRAHRRVEILNWDAHADVREFTSGAHSGSPFRQALLHASGVCRRYTVAGLQPQSVARAHLDFIAEHGGSHIWRRDVTRDSIAGFYSDGGRGPAEIGVNGAASRSLMVSFDLDAVDAANAPGVSAPAIGGFSVQEWLDAARAAGRCAAMSSVDIVELNPLLDVDGRTASIAALTVWTILKGMAERT